MKKYLFSALLASAWALGASAAASNGLTVYINPGHGGHDSNDRNVVIAPYTQGDPNGYWESNSNLSKGLALRDMLEAKGYKVVMSRVLNRTEDDLNLSTIVRLANNSNADIYFSIHSNATGTSARRNFPLMLYRGYDNEPENPQSKVVAEILNKQLLENQATYWTSTNINLRGDWSFYPSWGKSGLGALRGLTVTGMLSEGSFHDYIPEAYRLMSDDYCWLEAYHFRRTIDEYFKQPGEEVGAIIGRINDSRVPREGQYKMFGEDLFATVQGAKVELCDASGKLLDTYNTHEIHTNGIYCFRNLAPGTYTLKASVDTHYPESVTVEVKPNLVSYANMKLGKVRNTPPQVVGYSPLWKEGDEPLLCNTPVSVEFNWDMDTEATAKAISLSPAVEGVVTWEDLNYRMVFTPTQPLEINTLYTVTISTEATHAGGMKMEKPVSFSFKTTSRNYMDIIGQFPKDGDAVHYKNAAIEFRFDKRPDTAPILNMLTLTDTEGNTVAFNKRQMSSSKVDSPYGFFRIPVLKDLEAGKTYRLHLSGDFADRDGITIKGPVDVEFTAVDAGLPKEQASLIEGFNDAAPYVMDEAQTSGVASASVALESKLPLFDGKAVAFTYAFSATEAGEILWDRKGDAPAVTVTDADALGVHLNGDLSGNEVYLQFTSELGVQYARVAAMDFLGWRYCEVPLTTLEGGVPYTLTGVKLVQIAGQASVGGTFVLDNALKTSGSTGLADDMEITSVTVHPNPASEFIVANGGVMVEAMELVDMTGRRVAAARGNVLNVSEIAAGNYVVLVRTASFSVSRKVVVKH